jgi:hypothetical protein
MRVDVHGPGCGKVRPERVRERGAGLFPGTDPAERLAEYRARHEQVWPDMAPYFTELDGLPDQGFKRVDEIFHVD